MVHREDIIKPLVERLKQEDYISACWEGGAAAFNRVDEWSDIDLAFVVKDDKTKEAFAIVEEVLGKVSPIEINYEVPQSPWQGHEQKFYRLKDTSKFLLIDLSLFKENAPDKLLEPEIHGKSLVHFDKSGVTEQYHLDKDSHKKKLSKRIAALKTSFSIFGSFTEKELNRGNAIEAIGFYNGFTLRPLVEVLRIKYTPEHFNFYTRYVHYELPKDVAERLEKFFFISSIEELKIRQEEAVQWFTQIMAEFDSFTP